MSQFALPLDWPADETQDAFIIGISNAAAVRHLEAPGRWPLAVTLLTGPRKSGRSLLGRIFVARTGGQLVDDADRRAEKDVFDAWNAAQSSHRPTVLIAEDGWEAKLPDLASRLAATPRVAFAEPDEALVVGLLTHLLARRGLAVVPGVAAYAATRIERSHIAVMALVDALDAAALARRRAITVPLAREVIVAMHAVDGAASGG